MDIDLEKRYNLPEYKLVEYDDKTIAVMYNIGRWIVMDNKLQVEILCKIYCHYTVGEIVSEYKDNIDDIISVLVQIEAKQLENGSTVDICDYTSLQLCLTNKCNLRCPHCYMFSGAENENELTIKEICGICKDFRNYGGKEVILTGGEITTRGDLLEIISAISDTGLKISLFSNGVSWSEELIDFLKKVPVKKIQISIDGYDEKSNSKIRGPLAFEKALDTVNKLLANNFTVQIAVTPPFEEAIENDTRYIEFAKDLLVKHKDKNLSFRFSYSLIPGRTISEAKVKEMRETYYNAINHIGKSIYGEDDDVQGLVSNLKGHTIFNNCGYGGLNISSVGDVYFCSQISRVASYANIHSDCFAHIMELAERARDVSNVNNLAPCKECELKYICGGGCRADYFPEMCYMKEFSPDEVQTVPARQCSKEHKEKMYKLMIASNEDFFE